MIIIEPPHVSCFQNITKSSLDSISLNKRLKQEDGCLESSLGMSVIELQDAAERSLSNLAYRNIILPFQECSLYSLCLQLLEQVLRAQQGRSQELELGLLLDGELHNLLLEYRLVLIHALQLLTVIIQVLHVLRIALLLCLKGLQLILLELFFILGKYHHLFPKLESATEGFLLSLGEHILKVSAERVNSDFQLTKQRSELVEVLLDLFCDNWLRVFFLFISDFDDGDDLGFILDIKDRVIDDMFEEFVCD